MNSDTELNENHESLAELALTLGSLHDANFFAVSCIDRECVLSFMTHEVTIVKMKETVALVVDDFLTGNIVFSIDVFRPTPELIRELRYETSMCSKFEEYFGSFDQHFVENRRFLHLRTSYGADLLAAFDGRIQISRSHRE